MRRWNCAGAGRWAGGGCARMVGGGGASVHSLKGRTGWRGGESAGRCSGCVTLFQAAVWPHPLSSIGCTCAEQVPCKARRARTEPAVDHQRMSRMTTAVGQPLQPASEPPAGSSSTESSCARARTLTDHSAGGRRRRDNGAQGGNGVGASRWHAPAQEEDVQDQLSRVRGVMIKPTMLNDRSLRGPCCA